MFACRDFGRFRNLPLLAKYSAPDSRKYDLHQNHIAGSFFPVKFMGREDSQEKTARFTANTKYKSQSETENVAAHPRRSQLGSVF